MNTAAYCSFQTTTESPELSLSPKQREFYPGLEMLRGVAVVFVLLYHTFPYVDSLRFGWIGVDLFFVLSGFLVTDALIATKGNKKFFRNFYFRRALRIFPLYYLTLILFFYVGPFFFSNYKTNEVFQFYAMNQTWFWTYTQNFLFAIKGPAPMPYLTHFWSLAVEEQFYLFFPFIIFFTNNKKDLIWTLALLIAVSIAIRNYIYFTDPVYVDIYYSHTLTRLDSLLIGSILSVTKWNEQAIPKFISIAVIAFTLYFCAFLIIMFGNIHRDNLYCVTFGYTLFACFFGCLIAYFSKTNIVISSGRWKMLRPIRFLGRISYGIYVFHLPVYLIVSTQFRDGIEKMLYTETILNESLSLTSIAITLCVSSISFYFFEKPILSWKKYFS